MFCMTISATTTETGEPWVLLRTPITQMIFFNHGMLLLGSNHFLIVKYHEKSSSSSIYFCRVQGRVLNFSNYVLRQRWQLKLQKVMFGSFSKADVDSTSRTSTQNVTSRRGFFNHFSIIRSHYSCQMCSNYTGIKLEAALQSRLRRQNWTSVIICSRRPHNCKTGDFTSWKDRERLPNVQKWKMHVQSVQNCCFSIANMQIDDVVVAVVVMVA